MGICPGYVTIRRGWRKKLLEYFFLCMQDDAEIRSEIDRMNPPQATPLEWQWFGGFLKRLQPAEWRSCHNITHVVSLVQVSHP